MDLVKDIKLELRLKEQRDGDVYGKVKEREYNLVLMFDNIIVGKLEIEGKFISERLETNLFRIAWYIDIGVYLLTEKSETQVPTNIVNALEELVISKCLRYKSTDTKGYITPDDLFNGCMSKIIDKIRPYRID